MEGFVKGDVVVVPFPFTDLSSSLKRPALVVANLKGDDIILCQITSRKRVDQYCINLSEEDFASGHLRTRSIIRPNRIFTADSSLIFYKVGTIKESKMTEVEESLVKIFTKSM